MAAKQFATASGQAVAAYRRKDEFILFANDGQDGKLPGYGLAEIRLTPPERWRLLAQLCPELVTLRAASAFALKAFRAEEGDELVAEILDILKRAVDLVPEHWTKAGKE